MKNHTVAIAHAFDVGGEIETYGSVANGVHGLGIKEVMGSRWRKKTTESVKSKHSSTAFMGIKKKKKMLSEASEM